MDINQLMNSLKETYGFSKTEWNELNGEPLAEFSLWLTEEHISRFIEKAGRLTAIIESCANMVSICEPELKVNDGKIRCMVSRNGGFHRVVILH